MIRLQILQTNIFRIVWQIVRRITNEILGVRGLSVFTFTFQIYQSTVSRKRESFVAFAKETLSSRFIGLFGMASLASSDERLTLKTSALKLLTVVNLRYQLVDNTKLPCYTLPLTQHHSYLRNFPPLLICVNVIFTFSLCLFRYCSNMLYLSLAFCTKFTNKGLSYMANGKGCHKIVHLDLSGCEQVRGLLTSIIIHSTHYLFSDSPKAYSEFSKSAPGTSSSCRLNNNHVKNTQ